MNFNGGTSVFVHFQQPFFFFFGQRGLQHMQHPLKHWVTKQQKHFCTSRLFNFAKDLNLFLNVKPSEELWRALSSGWASSITTGTNAASPTNKEPFLFSHTCFSWNSASWPKTDLRRICTYVNNGNSYPKVKSYSEHRGTEKTRQVNGWRKTIFFHITRRGDTCVFLIIQSIIVASNYQDNPTIHTYSTHI